MLSSRAVLRAVQLRGVRPFATSIYPGSAFEKKTEHPLEYGNAEHMTKAKFDKDRFHHRTDGGGEDAQVPTKLQRWLLVGTRVYKNLDEIPHFVPLDTMFEMHERLRPIFIAWCLFVFYLTYHFSKRLTSNRVYHAVEDEAFHPKK
ncbi:hypothetical protein PMAYCL1PPCAC_16958 [Pristionchus mayeri]|uniref:Uncharacterized protein n=1 Tax=Pristionchus mayeri TaxID=1317129 RepID=A0AAN5CLU6_9BILA|nr:hypothetical protein PMAYCL1PPCAC_16958 [Pristionchus mayeri]